MNAFSNPLDPNVPVRNTDNTKDAVRCKAHAEDAPSPLKPITRNQSAKIGSIGVSGTGQKP